MRVGMKARLWSLELRSQQDLKSGVYVRSQQFQRLLEFLESLDALDSTPTLKRGEKSTFGDT